MTDEVDKLLADFDSEDSDTEDSAEAKGKRDSDVVKQLRDWGKRKEQEATTLAKEVKELRTFKSQVEEERRTTALTAAGLNARQATAFLKMYDSATPETIAEFKTEVLGQTDVDTPTSFAPSSPAVEDRSFGAKSMTKEEFKALVKVDEDKAMQLLRAGKVQGIKI
jgi:hypothetical protein